MKLSRKDLSGKIFLSHGADVEFLGSIFPKIGYNAGAYGWNWDAFDAGERYIVVAGYRSFPRIDYSAPFEAERKIKEQYYNREITQAQARAKYKAMLRRLVR